MRIERILQIQNFDCHKMVTQSAIFSKKVTKLTVDGEPMEQKKFNDNGIFSKRIFGDMDSKEEYSCPCGHLHGKFYEGCTCQKCGGTVEFVGMTIDKYGWIDLSLNEYNDDGTIKKQGNGCHVIEYIAYYQLEKIIGRENLMTIIKSYDPLTVLGDVDQNELESIRNSSPKAKYYYYGVEGLYEHYDEILQYYGQLRDSNHTDVYDFIKNRDDVFTDKIPVISIILRPAMRTADGLKLDDINIRYQNILKNLEMLRDPSMIQVIRDATIEEIQAEFMLLSEEVLDKIKSKTGIIRNQICGTRVNFSARNIISPEPIGYKMDEIILPYKTFLELYKFEIMNVLMTTENKTIKEAEKEWDSAMMKFNTKIYKIMCKMIKENEVGVLLNRNPTISFGSILYVKVGGIKSDFNDMTMSPNNLVLSAMAADYDGDVLNLISIKDKETREIFKRVFSPVHLVIDPNNGRFNNTLNLEKDQVLGMNSLVDF